LSGIREAEAVTARGAASWGACLLSTRLRIPLPCPFHHHMATTRAPLEEFLQPLSVDIPRLHALARSFCATYTRLAIESEDQFLPTPVSDSVLRPTGSDKGR